MYNYRVPQLHVGESLALPGELTQDCAACPAQARPTEAAGGPECGFGPIPLWASATLCALLTQLMEASKSGTVWFKQQ